MSDSSPSPATESTQSTRLRPGRLRLFRFIMFSGLIGFIIVACVGAELAARYYERHRSKPSDYFPSIYYPHRRLRYGLVPNSDYYGWFRINSHGFRGREVAHEKKPGVLRVICIGGSTTFDGGSVGKALPWPEVMEVELRKRLGTELIEVLNLGIGGATTLDSLIDLQMRALAFSPDLVIVYQGHNDLIYSIPDPRPIPSPLFPLEDRPRSSVVRWLTYNSLLYAKAEERVTDRITGVVNLLKRVVPFMGDEPGVPEDRDVALERGLKDFDANLTSIAAMTRVRHIPLALPKVVVPFPTEGQAPGACQMCEALSSTYGGVPLATLRSMFGRYDDVMQRLASGGAGVHYISTDGFVPNDDRHYGDPVHFGPEGSASMGVKMGEAVAPILQQIRASREPVQPGESR